ncbi:MAG: rhomboid family intramembrane serine protease [Bacteroidota bacterium]|nr:rhomboid family intramembrane serine protease [Bacteroidota bacterium]
MPVLKLTPAIKILLLLNVAIFALKFLLSSIAPGVNLEHILGLHNPGSSYFRFWQPITHIFMHADFMHIFLNMLGLVMFGVALEERWGYRKFFIYFIMSAIGGAALFLTINHYELDHLQKLVNAYIAQPDMDNLNHLVKKVPQLTVIMDQANEIWLESPRNFEIQTVKVVKDYYTRILDVPCIGASGGVYGVILAFGLMFPNVTILFGFFFPIPARIAVLILAGISIYNGFKNDPTDHVAHFAHLGGMLFGYILLKIWKENLFDKFRIK